MLNISTAENDLKITRLWFKPGLPEINSVNTPNKEIVKILHSYMLQEAPPHEMYTIWQRVSRVYDFMNYWFMTSWTNVSPKN